MGNMECVWVDDEAIDFIDHSETQALTTENEFLYMKMHDMIFISQSPKLTCMVSLLS